MGPGADMLEDVGIRIASEAITREALVQELGTDPSQDIGPDGKPIMHCSLTVFSQELTVFLGYNNLQLISDLTDWYDCRRRWIYRTKTQGTDTLINVWMNLFGATTPDILQTSLPRDAIGGGLTARIIFVYEPKKGKSVADPFQRDTMIVLHRKLLQDLELISMTAGNYTISEDFLDRWIPWYNYQDEHPPWKDYRMEGYMSRRPVHILKLCMILNAARDGDMILGVEDFDRAVDILGRTEVNMPKTFGGIGKSEHSDVMDKVMGIVGYQGKATFSELMRMFYFDVDERTLRGICATMEKMGFSRNVMEGKDLVLYYIKDKEKEDG
jgi:hypothetical protein